jgi:hypothetical protein
VKSWLFVLFSSHGKQSAHVGTTTNLNSDQTHNYPSKPQSIEMAQRRFAWLACAEAAHKYPPI